MKRNYIMICLLLLTVVAKAQTITEVYFPQYIQGAGTLNIADDRKVPFVCRMKLSGLNPNTTYRYYNRFVDDPTNPTSIGVGGYILVKDTGNFIRVTLASLSIP